MATLKHINSKNADYGAAEQYLLFEHDEFYAPFTGRGAVRKEDAIAKGKKQKQSRKG